MANAQNPNWWYYDCVNLNSALRQAMLKNGGKWIHFRYLWQFASMRIGMFSYKGLPGKLTPQILETALFFNNFLCFYKCSLTQEVLLGRYVPNGDYDEYWKPTNVNVLALNGKQIGFNVPYEEIIPVRDNKLDLIPFLAVMEYMEKLNEIENAISRMLKVGTLPVAFVGSKKISAQMHEAARQLFNGDAKPFIASDETLPDGVRSFDIKLTLEPLDLYELKFKYYSECMQMLGIYNVPEKHERMLVKELADQNDYVDTLYTEARDERRLFISLANERFGMNIELEETYDSNFQDVIEETQQETEAKASILAKYQQPVGNGGMKV